MRATAQPRCPLLASVPVLVGIWFLAYFEAVGLYKLKDCAYFFGLGPTVQAFVLYLSSNRSAFASNRSAATEASWLIRRIASRLLLMSSKRWESRSVTIAYL